MRVVEDEIEEIEIDLENNFSSKNQETGKKLWHGLYIFDYF